MLTRDIRDVATTDANIVQLTVGETLQLSVSALIFRRACAGRFNALNQVRETGAQVEAAMCQCSCMCHIFIPFCAEAYSPVVSICSFVDKAQIGIVDTANNAHFGLAAMRVANNFRWLACS